MNSIVGSKGDRNVALGQSLAYSSLIMALFALILNFSFNVEDPLALNSLPKKSYMTWLVKLLYCTVSIITIPLQTYPVTRIVMNHTEPGHLAYPVVFNALFCAVTATVAIFCGRQLSSTIGAVGVIACCPLSLILPALLHSRLGLAKSRAQRVVNVLMVGIPVPIIAVTLEEIIRTGLI